MKKFGEEYTLTQELMDEIATYMDDEIREELHSKMAPCEPEEFMKAYIERDPELLDIINNEFGLELED